MFRRQVENRLWPEGTQEASWIEIKRKAATDPSWLLHHPSALDDLKQAMVARDQWRDIGNGFMLRGPFPQPPAGVSVQVLHRDKDTGETRLRITPRHADRVRIAEDGVATPTSPELDGWELTTRDVKLSFLAEDSTGQHDPGEPFTWTSQIDVKYRVFKAGEQRMRELEAIPSGEIRYTIDGTSPLTSGQVYREPFGIPNERLLVLAIAGEDGVLVRGRPLRYSLPMTRSSLTRATARPLDARVQAGRHERDLCLPRTAGEARCLSGGSPN